MISSSARPDDDRAILAILPDIARACKRTRAGYHSNGGVPTRAVTVVHPQTLGRPTRRRIIGTPRGRIDLRVVLRLDRVGWSLGGSVAFGHL